MQTAIDKAVIDVDNYVKGAKVLGNELATLPHPKNSLPGTGIIGAIAEFKALDQNKPLTMQERVETVLGEAGGEIETIKERLKKTYQASKEVKTNEREQSETVRSDRVSTSGGNTGATTSPGEMERGEGQGKQGKGQELPGVPSTASRNKSKAPSTPNNEGSATESESGRGSRSE